MLLCICPMDNTQNFERNDCSMFDGKPLVKARKDMGYTLRELSDTLKNHYGEDFYISPKTINNWELNPNAKPKYDSLKKLCDFLNVNISILFTDPPKTNVDSDILEIIKRVIELYQANDPRINEVKNIVL